MPIRGAHKPRLLPPLIQWAPGALTEEFSRMTLAERQWAFLWVVRYFGRHPVPRQVAGKKGRPKTRRQD